MDKMGEVIEKKLKWLIENTFYYLCYPSEQDTAIWTDRDGNPQLLSEMELNHLSNCIKLVERDINNFENMKPKDQIYPELKAILMPRANVLLISLKKELYRKEADA